MQVFLQGPRVNLRPFVMADAPEMARLANDYDIWKTVSNRFPHPFTLEHAYERIEAANAIVPLRTLAICLGEALAGWIILKPQEDISRVSSEIGYWIGKPYWGQGVAREAIELMTQYGFTELNHSRIYAIVMSCNPASRKALLACGYQDEGYNRLATCKDGMLWDEWVLGRINPILEGKDTPQPWDYPE